jgi:hypothetical protein
MIDGAMIDDRSESVRPLTIDHERTGLAFERTVNHVHTLANQAV